MSRELSPAQRQELLALLHNEVRQTYAAAVAKDVDEAALIEAINESCRLLQSGEQR